MPTSHRASSNQLLASLHGVTLERMLQHLELVEMNEGDAVFESGTPQSYVYFPVTAVVALSYMDENGVPSDISMVGNEGVVGIPLFLNGQISPCQAVVRDSGSAYRLSAALMTSEFNRPGPTLRLFLAYARELNAQMAQTAHCDVHGIPAPDACSTCGYALTCPKADEGRLPAVGIFSASSGAATASSAARTA